MNTLYVRGLRATACSKVEFEGTVV